MPTLIEPCNPQRINKMVHRGRPPGAKGKANEAIRWGIVEAYRQLGGVDGLVQWGRKEPNLFYPMLTKLLPHELAEAQAKDGRGIRVLVYAPQAGTTSDKPLEIVMSADPLPVVDEELT